MELDDMETFRMAVSENVKNPSTFSSIRT